MSYISNTESNAQHSIFCAVQRMQQKYFTISFIIYVSAMIKTIFDFWNAKCTYTHINAVMSLFLFVRKKNAVYRC